MGVSKRGRVQEIKLQTGHVFQLATKLGAKVFFKKPFDFECLLRTLSAVVAEARSERSTATAGIFAIADFISGAPPTPNRDTNGARRHGSAASVGLEREEKRRDAEAEEGTPRDSSDG